MPFTWRTLVFGSVRSAFVVIHHHSHIASSVFSSCSKTSCIALQPVFFARVRLLLARLSRLSSPLALWRFYDVISQWLP